jgi:hypothetical protein
MGRPIRGLFAMVVCLLVAVMPGTVLLTAVVLRGPCRLATSADAETGVPPHGTSFPEF